MSRLLVGLTVVAFGTTAPELFLDVTAATRDAVDLAFGDLVGSNNRVIPCNVPAESAKMEQSPLVRVDLPALR